MITTALLSILIALINAILFLFAQLGNIPSNSTIVSSITTMSSYLSPLNNILPLSTILQILIFDITFETSFLAYQFIRWAYQKIPFIN